MDGMLRASTVLAIAAGISVTAYFGSERGGPPRTAPPAAKEAQVAAAATPTMSRRERTARLVAETAAATADRTAKLALAKKSQLQETAAR